jgi:hypothetical protein
VRFQFDERKSSNLRRNAKRGIGFEEAQEMVQPSSKRSSGKPSTSATSSVLPVTANRRGKPL